MLTKPMATKFTLINEKNSFISMQMLLDQQEAKGIPSSNDQCLLPRSLKRRTSLLEKSRDWARRFMTLTRSRRQTSLTNPLHSTDDDQRRRITTIDKSKQSYQTFLARDEKSFDEDGYLSPLEIKDQFDGIQRQQATKKSSEPLRRSISQCTCPPSVISEFHQSLSLVDYIDFDIPESSEQIDDPVDSIKYLFTNSNSSSPSELCSRRLPRRTTNVSSISTDSGYCDASSSTTKSMPLQIVSCTLLPVNIVSSISYPSCHTNRCTCEKKVSPKKSRPSLVRFAPVSEDLMSISRWYKPDLSRDAVSDVLQQSDYGAFVIRLSSTHPDCYVLSIKVPKFTHDSNIVHYLIERSVQNDCFAYRIKGTMKRFPSLLSLLTHHSVMPEILPITLNLYESISSSN